MNLSHFRQWLVSGVTQDDVDNMRQTGTVNLYSTELGCNDVLCIPPGWLMLEHSASLTSAGLAISWFAAVPGAAENVKHLFGLIPEGGSGPLSKLRTLLEVGLVALESLAPES